jgi:DNA invertase Pin-like site-specific DNA recombinase
VSQSAAVYVRISDDHERLGLGIARQERDCRELAERLGWRVAAVYKDNDVSASKRRKRPQYEQMLADLEAGYVTALLCYDVDRLTRHPVELEGIIELHERKGVALASVGGEIDLGTPQGRLVARIKGATAKHEVEQSSRRIKRKTLERAEAGKPHGPIAYGYRRVNGKDQIDPGEAAIVREATERVIAGESVRSICLDLQRRRIPTANGAERWQTTKLKNILLRERNAGLRIHLGKVIGKGDWEPIVDEATYYRAAAILNDPSRQKFQPGGHRYLLSGIAKCGLCGHPLRVLPGFESRPRGYDCDHCFKVRRKQEAVDALVTDLVIERLSRPDARQAFFPEPEDVQPLLANVEALKARLDLVADQYANDEITHDQLARITAKFRPQLEAAEQAVREATATPELIDLATPDIAERWDILPMDRKRAVIRLLMDIEILPTGRTGRGRFNPDSIAIKWKS